MLKRLRSTSIVVLASCAIGGGYFLLSRLLNDVFPFTVLNMYASVTANDSSRVLAIDSQGLAHFVDEYSNWLCTPALEAEIPLCEKLGRPYSIPYVERDNAQYVRDHAGTGNEEGLQELAIVRRVWFLDSQPGAPKWEQCEITRCKALPR